MVSMSTLLLTAPPACHAWSAMPGCRLAKSAGSDGSVVTHAVGSPARRLVACHTSFMRNNKARLTGKTMAFVCATPWLTTDHAHAKIWTVGSGGQRIPNTTACCWRP